MANLQELKTAIINHPARSAWDKGVKAYALELLEDYSANEMNEEFNGTAADMVELLNGAKNWTQYSEGGCALIYDGDICARLCSPSEKKRVRDGERNPNGRETWLDVQARALTQAARLLKRLSK
jgi:hypothetical protein